MNPTGDGGMGLGLAIVEQACALLEHPLLLRSELGKGTVFAVTAPAAQGVAAPPEPQSDSDHPPGLLSDMLVLVIENDATSRRAIMGKLEDWGASPVEAASLPDAQVQIAELGLAPDVILADHQLDDGATGLQAIAALRAAHGAIPAILVTADHGFALAEQADDAGVLVMTKPLALRRLKRVLQQIPHYRPDQPRPRGTNARKGDLSYWLHPED